MKEKLIKLLDYAYAPYSKYQVSAILKCKDGQEFSGVNVENASYGASICAERVAINKAISEGYRKGDFNELHIMSSSLQMVTPCFICRQTFAEFFDNNMKVYLYNNEGDYKIYTKEELCPLPFDSSNLTGGLE